MTAWPYTPRTSITEARASDEARRRRDLEEAKAAGLSPDEIGPYLRALAIFDAWTPAWEEREALAEALALAARRLAVLAVLDGGS